LTRYPPEGRAWSRRNTSAAGLGRRDTVYQAVFS
jgi:hypothetical protein